ncbi:hypothetical protein ACHAXR_006576 [Thalassiosira sp. AJA248-18]
MNQHSDSYNEHLLYARQLGTSSPSSGGENPQEAPPTLLPPGAIISAVDENNPTEETFIQQYLSRIITVILALALIGAVFVLLPYYAVHAAKNDQWNQTLYWTAGAFVLIAVPVSVHGIVQHLVNYYMPQVQKYVIRILFMVPIFSIQAWFSLFFHSAAVYIRIFRELYEAFVLSSFVYYIIELLGGDDQLALKLRTNNTNHGQHPFPFRLVFEDWQMGRPFMMNCKYGVLQYVLVKTIATIAVITLQSLGKYNTGVWAWDSAWMYIALSLNLSIGYALYCLVKLYYATKVDLKEWNPVWKFLCIKGIIFFTFWQGFLIEVLHSFGVIQDIGDWDSEHVVDGLQDFIISFEMVGFAIAHRYAFPHTDYIHYLQRHQHRGSGGRKSKRRSPNSSVQSEETLFLFDPDQNAVNDPSRPSGGRVVDVEYEPPSVRQLDRPMSVSRALLGVVPNETFSDIARMGMSGSVVVGDGGNSGARGGSRGSGEGAGDIVFSRDHAEGI